MLHFVSKPEYLKAVQFLHEDTTPLFAFMNEVHPESKQHLDLVKGGVKLSPFITGKESGALALPQVVIKEGEWLCFDGKRGEFRKLTDASLREHFDAYDPQAVAGNEAEGPKQVDSVSEPTGDLFPHDIDRTSKGFAVARPDINPFKNGYLDRVKQMAAHFVNGVEAMPGDGRYKALAITEFEKSLHFVDKALQPPAIVV